VDIARTLRTTDGVTLAYRLWRPGPPRRLILLVHGLASNHTRWTEFVRTTRLRQSWDLLRVDLRGFDGSLTRRQVGLEVWSRDLGAILKTENAPRVVVVGHCLGANIAVCFGINAPAAVEGLVLIEPMFREALTGGLRWAARFRTPVAGLAALVRSLNALGLHRRHLETLDLEQLDREARAAITDGGGLPENGFGSPLEDLKSTPIAVYLAGLLAVTAPLPLRAIRTPTLALLSRGGRYGDPAITTRRLAELPRCETRMLEAHHWIPTETPQQMRKAIEEWCEQFPA
jgi:pimeloyl-ACP methyl ester carboxylesterase